MRTLFITLFVFTLSSMAIAQTTTPQVTVWLYRPDTDNSGLNPPLFMDGRKLASLIKGQFFGIQLPAGLHAFNWTTAAGAESVLVSIGADPEAYLEVRFPGKAPYVAVRALSADKAIAAMTGLRPVDKSSVVDPTVIVPSQPIAQPPAARASVPQPAPVNGPTRQDQPTKAPTPAPQTYNSGKGGKYSFIVTAVTHESNVVSRTFNYQTPGTAQTSCSGSATTIGSTTNGNANCNTTYNPPLQHYVTTTRLNVVGKVQSENGQLYKISCSDNWVVSNCGPLIDGDKFNAEIENKTMWITAHKAGNQGKEVRIKYDILDIR